MRWLAPRVTHALTTAQAAELLHLTPRAIRKAASTGQLAATKHGRDWLIEREEADRYARSERRPGRKKRGGVTPAPS
jgi:excisionase family DNA binding protein